MVYVDAKKLKRNIRINFMPNVDVDGTVTVENAERYFLNLIDKTSTADVEEVKHGCNVSKELDEFECSECGFQCCEAVVYGEGDVWYNYPNFDYCPGCGVKIDGRRFEK